MTSAGYAATMMLEAGCSQLSVQQCHVADETPGGGTLPRDAFVAGSDFFRRPIPSAGIDALVAAVEHRQADPRLGGRRGVARRARWRGRRRRRPTRPRGRIAVRCSTRSTPRPGGARRATARWRATSIRWRRIHDSLRRYASGEAYQNYADDTLPDPLQAYYGDNLARLIEVRRTYDPSGVFNQPQGIPLA